MTIGKVVPELDGEPAEYVYIHATACGIVFHKIREVGWERSDFTKSLQQVLLVAPAKRPKKIEHFNGDEQTGVPHFASPDNPSLLSHCSGVNQRSGERSSIFSASLAA